MNNIHGAGIPASSISTIATPPPVDSKAATKSQMQLVGSQKLPLSNSQGELPKNVGEGVVKANVISKGLGVSQSAEAPQHTAVPMLEGRKVGWGAGPPPKPEVILAIEKRIAQDTVDFKQGVTSFHHLSNPDNEEKVTNGCSALRSGFKEMFESKNEFEKVWTEFAASSHGQGCAADLQQAQPNANLSERGYHNSGHAKEMYSDTYVKLKEKGFPKATCEAGATMAYFHDLVQGLDGFPNIGRNENVTAKLLQHLIETKMDPSEARDALKDLCDATIVGGTFLLRTTDANGTNPKNQTPSEAVDHSQFSDLNDPSVKALMAIRETMAENDISRTSNKESYTNLSANPANDPAITSRNGAISARREAVSKDPICNKLQKEGGGNVQEHMIGRMFQSIRMTQEIKQTVVGDKKELVQSLQAFISDPLEKNPKMEEMLKLIQTPTTWSGGNFSEGAFALMSGHREYSETLDNKSVTSTLEKATPKEVAQFALLALTTGQDGFHIK